MLCIANKTTQFVKFKRYVEGVAHCNVLQFMVFAWFQSYLNNFYFGTKASTSRKTYIQFSFFLLQITTFFPIISIAIQYSTNVQNCCAILAKIYFTKWHSKQTTFQWCHCYYFCWCFFCIHVCVCV